MTEEIVQDVRYAVRTLLKQPGFTLIAAGVLALGIGASTTLFSAVNGVLLRPQPDPEQDRLVFLGSKYPQATRMRAAVSQGTPDYFRVLGANPTMGPGFTEADFEGSGARVVMVSDGLWKRRFGADPRVIGRTILASDGMSAELQTSTIVGVLPAGFENRGTAGDRRAEVPRFEEGTQVFDNAARTWESGLADLNGDGHLDLVFTSLDSATQVLFNDGTGHFRRSSQVLASHTHGIAIGDLDGDGDQDLFLAVLGRDRPSAIYVNDRSGSFTRTNINLSVPSSERVALVDVDGDGDLDAYLWYSGRLYVNDGAGVFSQSPATLPQSPTFADLNGDGAIDILSLLSGSGFSVYLNDGAGTFIQHHVLPKPDLAFSYVAFADVDDDRDLDVVFSNSRNAERHPSGVLVNDGTGRLVDSGQEMSRVGYGFVCTGDLNADGWVDVILTDRDQPPRIWLNEGGGKFVDSGISLGVGGLWNNCTIADIDGDGDRDVFVTRVFGGNHGVWFNRWIEGGRKGAARGASPTATWPAR